MSVSSAWTKYIKRIFCPAFQRKTPLQLWSGVFGLLQIFHLFDEGFDFVHIELDEHDVAVQQDVRDNRGEDALGPLIEGCQDQSGREVEQEMRELEMDEREDECRDGRGDPEVHRLVQGAEDHSSEDEFFEDRAEQDDRDDRVRHDFSDSDERLGIGGSRVDADRHFDHGGDRLPDDQQQKAEDAPADSSGKARFFAFPNIEEVAVAQDEDHCN